MKKYFYVVCLCILILSLIPFSFVKGSETKKVIVLGSEPEAIAAALKARELGYQVTLITEDEAPGGLMTLGMLTALDLNYDEKGQLLHQGFVKELLAHCGNAYNLDYHSLVHYFNQVLENHSIQCIYHAEHLTPIVDQHTVIGAYYMLNHKAYTAYADFIVDGSHEASFSRQLSIPYLTGYSEFGMPSTYAAATLVFSVKNVDWDAVTAYLTQDGDPHTGVQGNAAWGYNALYTYPAVSSYAKLRGLNLSRQNDGSVMINGLLLFYPKDTAASRVQHLSALETFLYQEGKKELPFILDYLQKHAKGFEHALLDETAKKLYIREGVRIVGDETLTAQNIFEHTACFNTIAYGSYPMDLQATDKSGYGIALCGRSLYSIPFGTMLVPSFDGLLIIGRNASFDIMAHGSARTLPVLISMAENGVVAMDFALNHHLSAHQLNTLPELWPQLYSKLEALNAFKQLQMPVFVSDWTTPYKERLMARGLYGISYQNLDLSNPENDHQILYTFCTLLQNHTPLKLSQESKDIVHHFEDIISLKELLCFFESLSNTSIPDLKALYQQGYLDALSYQKLADVSVLTPDLLYVLLEQFFSRQLPINHASSPLQDIFSAHTLFKAQLLN